MSDKDTAISQLAHSSTPDRQLAVASALEIIKNDVLTSSGPDRLKVHLSRLSQYADLIEDALKKK
ncbi:hypothetical protein [Vibrio algicola]|uniref:Uncharacterized protein n=1 Tax=Vibrio algicola TaxID=2662262 RepID=A0A5Q0TKK6_9VIBR|nr:hypothetical protein [Vibrio algicola]